MTDTRVASQQLSGEAKVRGDAPRQLLGVFCESLIHAAWLEHHIRGAIAGEADLPWLLAQR